MNRQAQLNNRGKQLIPGGSGLVLAVILAISLIAGTLMPVGAAVTQASIGQVEPQAGQWRTWVLASGSQLRPAAPPDKQATRAEILELKALAKQRDQATLDRISYWNTGGPAYRWNEIAIQETLNANQPAPVAGRGLALMHAAIYDATIAAWDAKYHYKRPRPARFDRKLSTTFETPRSPSYPSEHAVAAGAASEVLAYLFPARAEFFRQQAQQAAEAFLYAGVQYRSDIEVGLELGRQVGALVAARGQADNSGAVWDGSRPQGPGYWSGQNPALPMAGTWKTWVLENGSQFRPAPPFAYDSAEMAAEMDELRSFQRTPKTNAHALFYEYGAGGTRVHQFWNDILSRKVLEFDLGVNPPREARAFALMNIAYYDAMVACWDAKYAYWAIRPFQLDPAFQTVFATPGHPSYPSAHSCLSGASADLLAYLFPRDAASVKSLAEVIGESRIWAGLHFRNDIVAGEALAKSVADKVLEHAQNDGSQ